MKYPKPLKHESKIAITAFSSGINQSHLPRFNEIKRALENRGLEVIVGNCLMQQGKQASSSKEERAKEFQKFLLDDTIDAIAPPWGGELAMEILPLLDFDKIGGAKPKWVFGFSDVSTITAVMHDRLNWATVHSSNLMDLIDTAEDHLTSHTLDILAQESGSTVIQTASESHTFNWPKIDKDPLAFIKGEIKTEWKWLNPPKNEPCIKGRLIGGCWDTLFHIFNTEYLDLQKLKERSPERKLLLFLENVEQSPSDLVRSILNMEFRGVFNVIDGLILGRNFRKDSGDPQELTYLDVLNRHLKGKSFPIIYDVDIGHAPPNLTLINGATAEIGIENGRGYLKQILN